MRTTVSKISPLLVCMTLVLGACAQRPARDDAVRDAPASPRAAPAAAPAAPTPPAAAAPAARPADVAVDAQRQFTGIAACDEYLASYRSCHAVIGAYPAETVDERLDSLRATWQERARDPAQHEALTVQCQNLAETMKEALAGRDCPQPESEFVGADGG